MKTDMQLSLLTEQVSKTDLAYMAGLFDGEGYIRSQVKENRNGHHGYGLVLGIGIVNTDEAVLKWVQTICGGSVKGGSRRGSRHPYPGAHPWLWRPCYEWTVTDRNGIGTIIAAIYPYLRIKRDRASLLLQLLTTLKGKGAGTEFRGGVRRKASFSLSYWNQIKELADAISAQNTKRGTEKYESGPLLPSE